MSKDISIFWSWQSDSSTKTNRNFIEQCLKNAITKLKQNSAMIIEIDRDTKGKGGTPDIANTILKKIRDADIFVWDATLCYSKPRPSPNPNVLFELGYAISFLGEGRIIGIMNTSNGFDGNYLPFDLKHRRWPISYSLIELNIISKLINKILNNKFNKNKVKEELTTKLVDAIIAAIKEPKSGAFPSDVDFNIANTFWNIIDSKFIIDWYNWRTDTIQYERRSCSKIFDKYEYACELPENNFNNETLKEAHNQFTQAIAKYRKVQATEMVPDGDGSEFYVITTKAARGWVEDYDKNISLNAINY